MDMSYMRAVSSPEYGAPAAVEAYVWRRAMMSAVVVGLLGGTFLWYAVAAPYWHLPSELALFVGLGTLFLIANSMATARARVQGRYRLLAKANLAGGVGIATVSIVAAKVWRQDSVPIVLAALVGYLVPVVILGIPRLKMLFGRHEKTARPGSEILAIGVAATITAPMYWAVSSSDRWFLAFFEGTASAGIYAVGYSIGAIGLVINSAIQLAWLPEVSREYADDRGAAAETLGRVSEQLIVALGILWLAIAAGGGDLLRLLVAEEFYAAADVVPFIATGTFFYAVAHIASTTLLVVGRFNETLNWWFAGGILCVLANLYLVPRFGRLGAASVQALVFAGMAAGIWVTAQRRFPVRMRTLRVSTLLLAVAMFGFALARPWSDAPITSLAMKGPVVIVTAFAVMRQIREDIVSATLRMLAGSVGNARSRDA
jgi:O-antigen/teichoic acid export membrane protein